ncbi:MFS transporter [Lacisediminihabitans sp. G11-30]|uniref:MFS transporter n=1 Tax=Lacisediminihabitans changchengi TaxID=2787634 RepID=A0A934W4N3_9MICO|nr:MDR family MFS transporter [Lacisediminihabitans changchengi]MBK4348454.1 MFS transporter [Lacisediminihabitans changchengi]
MSHRQILLVIYGLMAGMFLSSLDQTIVGTAIRTIGDDLHGLNDQAWVTTAYLITSTISVPIYGKLSDIFGRRPLYIFGIVVFLVGSLLSSFSTSMFMLAGFRAFQGIGAGALMSLPLAIMGDILAPRERAKYQGYFLAVFGLSSVIGPLIGGLFAGAPFILFITGWRWVFLINVPIGIIALLMVLAFLHLPKFTKAAKPRIDWWGATAVVATLVPVLLVAEEGRNWGWTSAGSIACYVIGAIGLISFILIERYMGADAIIPLRLFKSRTFSMATVLGVLVGFGMFGALLTLPLYLQIVFGLTPTESGLASLPLMAGLLIASIGSGQIIARTGKYRIFPVTGTAILAIGYLVLTFLTDDKPLWYIFIAMFLIGLGLGQMMQTLTLASQNSVEPHQMGVATGASTFFRQIGGTLGVAVLLSVLFAALPGNIIASNENTATLSSGLNAALTPSVATASGNKAIMKQLWNPIVEPVQENIQKQLDAGVAQIKAATAGNAAAEQQGLEALAAKAHASVVGDSVEVNWANASQRSFYVDKVTPSIVSKLKDGSTTKSSDSASADTSFLNGADPRLTKAFKVGFNSSVVTIYWIGLGVILLAFVITLFFRVPPLRKTSALQQRADEAGMTETGSIQTRS